VVPQLALKKPVVKRIQRQNPLSSSLCSQNNGITRANRSASRECMLNYNPFKSVQPNDKIRAQTPKAIRPSSQCSRNSAGSISYFRLGSAAVKSKLFEDTLKQSDSGFVKRQKSNRSLNSGVNNTMKSRLYDTTKVSLGQAEKIDLINDKKHQKAILTQLI
jgi:hypothetical protein